MLAESECYFNDTCYDAVERLWQQVIDLLPLVSGWPAAVDLVQGGVGVVHPLHQPLEIAVAYQVVATQISTRTGGPHGTSVVRFVKYLLLEHVSYWLFISNPCSVVAHRSRIRLSPTSLRFGSKPGKPEQQVSYLLSSFCSSPTLCLNCL